MRPSAEPAAKADNDKTPHDGDAKNNGDKKAGEPPSADSEKTDDSQSPSPDVEGTEQENTTQAEAGIVVRMVYADSPAAAAGVQAGDRIVEINDTKVTTVDDAIQTLNNVAAESKVALRLVRDGKPLDLSLIASPLPNNIPSELPAANALSAAGPDTTATAGELIDLKLPEFKHSCRVYLPGSDSAAQPFGALLWLQAPGDAKADDIIHQWQKICDRDGIVLIVPTPKDSDHWERTDLEYLHRLLERVVKQYKIDPHRVVVGGQGATGSIAWHLGLASRDMVRGIATTAAPLSREIKVPPNDPAQRLAIFAAIPPKKDLAAQIAQGLKSVADAGYNVATITTVTTTGQFSDAEREELARWLDSMDRF